MGDNTNWKILAVIGLIFVGITFTDLSPDGPWNDETFTSGSIGLVGLILLYMAWFRFTFDQNGLIPTIDLWQDPAGTSKTVIFSGGAFLAIGFLIGRSEFFPEPAGLIMTLIGCLTLTNGVYVWLSVVGPLSENETESE